MFNKVLLASMLVITILAASVPCNTLQATKLGTASDCSINRDDSKSITWGAKINFNASFTWSEKSYGNILADPTSPRLPVPPTSSKCSTKSGSYSSGQSVLINCTQGFDSIPTGYSNVVSAFEGADYPLSFTIKIPLGL